MMFWLLHGHGVIALATLFQGYRFRRAVLADVAEETRKQALRFVACMLTMAASGIALYVAYRAPGGVRTYLMAHYPLWHTVGFEWKEALGWFATLLALGLAAVATRAPLDAGDKRLAIPLLATLLVCMLVATSVGAWLSFCIKALA